MQCLAWLGASVATKTASIASSLTSSSSEGYVFSQRQALASAAQRSGNRSLTATTVDVGMVLEAERGAELADAVADDPHADLPVGDRPPDLPGASGRLDAPGPQDLGAGLLGLGRGQQAIGRDRPETERAQERSSRVGVVHHRCLRGRGWWPGAWRLSHASSRRNMTGGLIDCQPLSRLGRLACSCPGRQSTQATGAIPATADVASVARTPARSCSSVVSDRRRERGPVIGLVSDSRRSSRATTRPASARSRETAPP